VGAVVEEAHALVEVVEAAAADAKLHENTD
jgi:hypothetical protein